MNRLSKIIISGFIVLGFLIHAKNHDIIELQLPLHAIILNSDYTLSDQIAAMQSILDGENFNINVRDRHGRTALNLATYLKKDKKIIEFLLNHGANVNEPDLFNETPLHYAIKFDAIPVAQILLAAKANKNYKNDNGQTPFDLARTDQAKDILAMQD